MKRLSLLTAAVFFAVAGSASAADLGRLPTKAPPPAPVPITNWTGFYLGINGGGAYMDGPSMSYTDLAVNAYFPANVDPTDSSGVLGVHAGYNWQFSPNWLVGIEGDWDWTNLKSGGTQGLVCAGPGRVQCGGVNLAFTDNATLQTNVNWLASIRGRLGYTWNQWLFYASGGVAFADTDFSAQVVCTNVAPSFCNGISQSMASQFSDTRVGAVVGGGVEYKPARNWIVGAEYLFYDFNSTNTTGGSWVFANGTPAPFFECTVAGQNCAVFNFGSFGIHTGRVRLTYQFEP